MDMLKSTRPRMEPMSAGWDEPSDCSRRDRAIPAVLGVWHLDTSQRAKKWVAQPWLHGHWCIQSPGAAAKWCMMREPMRWERNCATVLHTVLPSSGSLCEMSGELHPCNYLQLVFRHPDSGSPGLLDSHRGLLPFPPHSQCLQLVWNPLSQPAL